MNASDDRGIDVVREQIKSFASNATLYTKMVHQDTPDVPGCKTSPIKLVVLDEADNMTNAAQDALRRGTASSELFERCMYCVVIEKYVKNVRFCLICNDVSKITLAVQSRCTLFRFEPLPVASMRARLATIVTLENLTGRLSEDATDALLELAEGDMRKVLNMLQSVVASCTSAVIRQEDVYHMMHLPTKNTLIELLESVLTQDFDAALHRNTRYFYIFGRVLLLFV